MEKKKYLEGWNNDRFTDLIRETSRELRDSVGFDQWRFTDLCEEKLRELVLVVVEDIGFEIKSSLEQIMLDVKKCAIPKE